MNTCFFDAIKECKGQRIIFLNVRSIMSNLSQIQADFKTSNILALALCETWLSKSTLSGLINLEGFTIARQDRDTNKKGGGVLM